MGPARPAPRSDHASAVVRSSPCHLFRRASHSKPPSRHAGQPNRARPTILPSIAGLGGMQCQARMIRGQSDWPDRTPDAGIHRWPGVSFATSGRSRKASGLREGHARHAFRSMAREAGEIAQCHQDPRSAHWIPCVSCDLRTSSPRRITAGRFPRWSTPTGRAQLRSHSRLDYESRG
jgi:hypothetical protein